MNALLNHVWGKSRAADRIWASVTGMRPSVAVGRSFMVLQAFIDESYTKNQTFVFGGYVATAETWSRFAADWERVLPKGTLTKDRRGNDTYHFKMAEMAVIAERMERVPQFFSVIDSHDLVAISLRFNISELRRARSRIWIPNTEIEWGYTTNPYLMGYRLLIDMFHSHRDALKEIIPPDHPVDFIFDEQIGADAILRDAWAEYVASRSPEIRHLYGQKPRFENDQDFLPLQAADFWAWWVRKWHEEGTPQKILTLDFGNFKARYKRRPIITLDFTEDQLFSALRDTMRSMLADQGESRIIYDVKFSPFAPVQV